MKNKKPLNVSPGKTVPDIPESESAAGLTAEELELYREMLEAVYPKPKRDIKASVMEVIRQETRDTQEKPLSKKAVAKKSRRELMLKWGSLAASIVIVAGIGIRVLPAFLSDNLEVTGETSTISAYDSNTQDVKQADAPESTTETFFGTGIVPNLYKMALSDAKEEGVAIAEEDTSVYYDMDAAEAFMLSEENADAATSSEDGIRMAETEAVAEEEVDAEALIEEEAEEEATPTEAVVEEAAPALNCPHMSTFRNSYHEIPSLLIDEVGRDAYIAWANEVSRDDSCAVNIYNFLQHFEISETMFVMYLQNSDITYYCDYPIHILYGGDADMVEAYYSSGGLYDMMVSDYFEYHFKLALIAEISVPVYTEWLGNFVSQTVRGWSIAQFVRDHGITEARFLEIYNETADAFREEFEGCVLHEYDIAKVFVPTAEIQLALSMSVTGYQADLLCRK